MIQYDDGTFGAIEPADRISVQLDKHFAGESLLPRDPVAAFFGTKDDLKTKQEQEDSLSDLRSRLEALERKAAIEERGIVAVPTQAEMRKVMQQVRQRTNSTD